MAISRQTQGGLYTGLYTIVFVAILVAVNYFANQYNKSFDSTEQKLYSLSDQTLKIVRELESDIAIHYFDRSLGIERAKQQLVPYENSSSKVTVEYVDIDRDPVRAEEMEVRSYGSVIVEANGRRETARSAGEQDVTNAIVRLLKGQDRTACFTTGHGEAGTADRDRLGFAAAGEQIRSANYKLEDVSLTSAEAVPAGCSLVVVAGAQNAFLDPEIEMLGDYVAGGGRLMLLVDYQSSPELVGLAARWGIEVTDEIVLDFNALSRIAGGGPMTPLVVDYGGHPIGSVLEGAFTVFPVVRPVQAGDAPAGWDLDEIARSQASSFARKGLEEGTREFERDPKLEREGPIPVAVAGKYEVPAKPDAADDETGAASPAGGEAQDKPEDKPEGRVIVVGTSNFARNNTLGAGANLDLFLNMVSWLTSDEDLISIRPKDPANTPLNLTQGDVWRIFLYTMVLIPLLIGIVGIRMWWLRR